MIVNKLNWGKCDWFYPKDLVKRKVYQGSENCTLSLGVLEPGHIPGPHAHEYEQTVIILKGKCDFHVGDEVVTIDADFEKDGNIFFMTIPGNVEHWIHNHYDKPVFNMDLFIPKRLEDRPESVEKTDKEEEK